jgi:thiol-disulfide isomerase/thioredoxin
LIVEKLLNPKLSELDSLSLLDSNAILAFKLQYLFRFLYTETFYSPVLLNAVNELKVQHPNSLHLAYLEPQVQKLKAYLKAASTDYDKGEIIETNYIRFADLIESFKGQNILVDLWATWCAPCIKEFNYKSRIKPYVDNGKIVILYISIDNETSKKKWKENIKFNQLEGYHALANDVFVKDMWQVLGGDQGVIPRYALIDKNGNIVLNNAARPSDGEKLTKQIESLLSQAN